MTTDDYRCLLRELKADCEASIKKIDAILGSNVGDCVVEKPRLRGEIADMPDSFSYSKEKFIAP